MDIPACVNSDKVKHAKDKLESKESLVKMAALFSMLADEGRLTLLHALKQSDMCVHELALTLDASTSAVSHQLRKLRDRGLVSSRRDGQIKYYTISHPFLIELLNYVDQEIVTMKKISA